MSWPRKINSLQLQTSLSAPTEAKGFSGALTNLGHNQPHKQTPPSGLEGVLERNLSAERAAYGTSRTQPQVSATCGLHDVIVELSCGLRHENGRAAKPTPPNAAATSDYVLPDKCVSVGPERQRKSLWLVFGLAQVALIC
jgi:hypothetical protein